MRDQKEMDGPSAWGNSAGRLLALEQLRRPRRFPGHAGVPPALASFARLGGDQESAAKERLLAGAGVPFVAVVSRPQNLGSGEPSHDGDASPQRRGCSWTDLAHGACIIGVKAAQQQSVGAPKAWLRPRATVGPWGNDGDHPRQRPALDAACTDADTGWHVSKRQLHRASIGQFASRGRRAACGALPVGGERAFVRPRQIHG